MTASTPPRISVLIPTYRYARFLPEAAGSVLAQQGADFELLISDDASGDGSAEIARELAARDRRVRVWVQPANLGMVAHWNFCLAQARGDYVQFVFGDDRLNAPDALAQMAALLDREPRAAIASCARALIGERSEAGGIADELPESPLLDAAGVIRRCLVEERNLIGEPTAVMFRRAGAGARGFDPALRQFVDLEFWLHLLRGGGLAHTARPLCAFRRHGGQATAKNAGGHAASVDFLILLSRYHRQWTGDGGIRPGSAAYRRRLFRQIYYARKSPDLSPARSSAEADLRRRLGVGWFRIHWVRHRLMKPAENVLRHLYPDRPGNHTRGPAAAAAHPNPQFPAATGMGPACRIIVANLHATAG